MKLLSSKLIASAVAVAALASTASLHAITFSFTESGGNVSGSTGITKTDVGTGLQVTVNGLTTTNGNNWFYRDISRNGAFGLGVDGSNDSHTIDNDDSDDFLLFTFSQPVDVNSFTMGYINGDSDYRWAVGTPVGSLDGILDSLWSAGINVSNGVLSPGVNNINGSNALAKYLLIGASSSGDNDQFKISAVNVTYTTSVPDGGSTLLLLGSALAGLGLSFRRRKTI